MSINPGFGGQSFMTSQLKKIEALRAMAEASGRDIPIEVDGGVTTATAPLCMDAGASVLVAGTAVFRGGSDAYADNIRALKGR
jgi:ribulose-phosphate 3-epimerase